MSNEKTDENHALFSYVIQRTCGFHVFSLGIKTHASHELSHFYWLSNFELLMSFRRGALGFSLLDVFLNGFSVFVSKDFGFSVLVFNAVCGVFVF